MIENIEDVLFTFVKYIKSFHSFLITKYHLKDSPYDSVGTLLDKKGKEIIQNNPVDYQFHGRGCTFYWNNIEVSYNVDVTGMHQIMIGAFGLKRFIETFSTKQNIKDLSLLEITDILEKMENKGTLMQRKPSDLGTWHVNELWYTSYIKKENFTGWNKSNIDWI